MATVVVRNLKDLSKKQAQYIKEGANTGEKIQIIYAKRPEDSDIIFVGELGSGWTIDGPLEDITENFLENQDKKRTIYKNEDHSLDKICANCTHWRNNIRGGLKPCKESSPQVLSNPISIKPEMEESTHGLWPSTYAWEECGKFERILKRI